MTEIAVHLLKVLSTQILLKQGAETLPEDIEEIVTDPDLEIVSALPLPDSLEDIQAVGEDVNEYWL